MKVAFTTLGCRLNQFETEGMRHRLEAARDDVQVVGWDDAADVYVINSCTVTGRAEQKCRQLARGAKRKAPASRVMVVGCYSQLNGDRLTGLDEVDAVLGNEEKRVLDRYLDPMLDGEPIHAVAPYRRGATMAEEWIGTFTGHARATIKVQEGCDMRCTFCAIWRARGPHRSRPPRDVVEQAERLATAGYREIVLAGVHLGHYGRDLSPTTDLMGLLDMLLEVVDERVRFRISSIDPGEVDLALSARLASDPRLCRYLHLPLQSGSDPVLRRMRRAYSRTYYRQLVEGIHAQDPAFGLGADIIVGFPGETDAEFQETLDLLERLPLSFYHVFRYSDRPQTAAERMGDKVPGPVAAARSETLRRLGARKRTAFLDSLVGARLDGIVESRDAAGRSEIMLDNYATVWCPTPVGRERDRVQVQVEARDGDRLTGTLVAQAAEVRG